MIDINKALNAVEKRFGKEVVLKNQERIPRFSSGSLLIDEAMGGGFPYGRIIECAGWESSGKTTMAVHASISVQKEGKKVVFIDSEHAFDPFYAQDLGLEIDIESKDPSFVLLQPITAEDGFEAAKEFLKVSEVGLIVFDSVAAMQPKAILEGEAGEQKMGVKARLLSQEIPKLLTLAKTSNTAVILINQFREKIGVMFGDPKTTPGGNAIKFYSSVRLELSQKGKLKDSNGDFYGIGVKVKVIKNKTAPPFKETETQVLFGKGINVTWEILNIALEKGIVEKKGSWYNYGKTKLGQGESNVIELMQDNPEMVEEIANKVLGKEEKKTPKKDKKK